jgi:SAM-dependent methyltransferase
MRSCASWSKGADPVDGPLSAQQVLAARGPWAGQAGQLDAPFWPTPPAVVDAMLDLAGVGPGDFLIDLGCGDGRIAIAAARRGARALGTDIDPDRITEARKAARLAGVGRRARFRREDLFATGLEKTDVVTLYLVPHVNAFLHGRLLDQLRPGSRIVSHAFGIAGWTPDAQAEVGHRVVSMWTVPGQASERET